jgi:hypothetical protein
MRVYLNEKSVVHLTSEQEAVAVLTNISLSVPLAHAISNNQHIQRHRELKSKEILPGISLGEFVQKLLNDSDGAKRKIASAFLILFSKGPFMKSAHPEPSTIVDESGRCLRESCFDPASSERTGAAMISFAPPSEQTLVQVRSSIFGPRKLVSIHNPAQMKNLVWQYEENKKHDILEDRTVNGKVHSAMLLPEEIAKDALRNGVMFGRSVYNKVGEQWYKFNCHGNNLFHGFPISLKPQTKELMAAVRFVSEGPVNRDGQVFGDEVAEQWLIESLENSV